MTEAGPVVRSAMTEWAPVMAGYVALVHKDQGTSYGVSFPDLPGCISAGDTMDEALANGADALAPVTSR
jgi:predicted RNase H-like HicB family nuclease